MDCFYEVFGFFLKDLKEPQIDQTQQIHQAFLVYLNRCCQKGPQDHILHLLVFFTKQEVEPARSKDYERFGC
jgi:hypothetical protein